MTYPDDVLKAAREAAAKFWESIDAKEFADDCREGKDDEANEVQAACIAIMAERERCARIASRMEVGGIVETPEFITAILGQREVAHDGA